MLNRNINKTKTNKKTKAHNKTKIKAENVKKKKNK